MNAVFDQAQINRDRAAMLPSSATTALPELLRCSLACLLLAMAFAAFAHPAGSELTLLETCEERIWRLRRFRPAQARARSEAEYIREMAGEGKIGRAHV